jgi:decaprenylphospho-beta-D-ribofuranose 2-oxidase
VYLAKDARLSPERFAAMYPRVPDLAAVRARVDPGGVLGSDLSRRLGLDPSDHKGAARA